MLPPEITDEIISNIDPSDTATLNACAATHSSMVVTSRARVFAISSVKLPKLDQALSLFKITSSTKNTVNRYLSNNLKTLTLGETDERVPPASQDLEALTSEIFVFQNLESLAISSSRWKFNVPGPNHVPEYPALLPKLTSLVLSYVQFDALPSLIKLVCACPRLESLRLIGVSWLVEEGGYSPSHALPATLKSLDFSTLTDEKANSMSSPLPVRHYATFLEWILACHEQGQINGNDFPEVERIKFQCVHNRAADSLSKLFNVWRLSLIDIWLSFLPGHHEADVKLWNHPTMRGLPHLVITRLSGAAYFK